MNKLFTPKSCEERMVAAAVGLVMDMQFAIQVAMKERGISQKKLAELMDCSASNVSQMLADESNPRIETIAKALAAMDENFMFASESLHGKCIVRNFEKKASDFNDVGEEKTRLKELRKEVEQLINMTLNIPKKIVVEKVQQKKSNDNSWQMSSKAKQLSEQFCEAA